MTDNENLEPVEEIKLMDVSSLYPREITDLSREELQKLLKSNTAEDSVAIQKGTTNALFIEPKPWTDPLEAKYGGSSKFMLLIENLKTLEFTEEQICAELGVKDYSHVELLIETARHILNEKRNAYYNRRPKQPTLFEDTSQYDQDPDRFLKLAKQFVVGAHAVETAETGERELTVEDLYIVWFSKTLQNWKALVSTTVPGDGLYFEVTHNGEKLETYVDTYKKTANNVFSHHDF